MANMGENSDIIISKSITTEIAAFPVEFPLEKIEGRENKCEHVEELDKWVGSLERILEDVPSYMCSQGHPGRISRIPDNMREVDVKGYEPYIMSIGPYHNGKPKLEQVEMRKKLVLKFVLQNNPELTLKEYLIEIINIEPTIRSFYSDMVMDTEQFVRMLLLDSVYLVITFCGMPKREETINEQRSESRVEAENSNEGSDENNEVKSGENWYWNSVAHDLFLIENQLPFFLLQMIYNLVYGSSENQLIDIMKYEVVNMLINYTKLDIKLVFMQTEEIHHLLHLCHMFFRPTIQQDPNPHHFPESTQMFRLGSAVQLYEAGVHFEARSSSKDYSLLDIQFDSSGNLVMPCLHVDDNTESLLRNLIALEQMKYPSMGLHVSAYVVLMLHLVTIPKDVELLRRKGIVQHHLSSDKEMLYLVNRLSTGLAFDYVEDIYSLKHVFMGLELYTERRVPRWRAWLRHRHFSNPWTTISLLAATLLLLLTALQTYYTVYSYYYPYYN